VRFLLAAFFWLGLTIIAGQQYRRARDKRDFYIVLAAAAGLTRELVMLVLEYGAIRGIVPVVFSYRTFPPLEHALTDLARVLLGFAYLRYFVHDQRLDRAFLRIGLFAVAVLYLFTAPLWIQFLEQNPQLYQGQGPEFAYFWGDAVFRATSGVLMAVVLARLVLERLRGRAIPIALLAAFGCLFLDETLLLINLAVGFEAWREVIAPLRHNLGIWAIPLFLASYWNELFRQLAEAKRKSDEALGEQVRIERDLREAEERYRVLVENVDIGICLIDSDFRLVAANSAQAKLFRTTPDALVGQCCYERFEGRATPCSHCPGIEAMATGKAVSREIQATPPGHPMRVVRIQAFPVRGENGKTRGFIEVVEDVTTRRAAEAEKRAFEERLRDTQKLESLGLLAGGIAHDFNNLLLGLLGNVDLARARLAPDSAARPHVDAIEGAAQRAADLTAQMLAYSGRGRLLVSSLDVSSLVEEMGGLLATVISKSAEVRFRLSDDLPLVDGDGTQLRQVVMNLITNASDALTGRSGTITITTGARDLDRADLACMQLGEGLAPGRYVFVEVVDSGIGMDAETRRRMFDPFFTTKQTGRGLGLAAALGIVRGHRGAVLVESAPGVGTSFSIFLPAGQGRATPRAVAREKAPVVAAPLAVSQSRRVMVVDDEESVREVATMILVDSGYDVVMAADGREALDLYARSQPVAAVLLDVTMPRLDGEQTLVELRRIDPGVRVVLTSGYTNAESAKRLVGEGLASFLPKPYRANELLDAIALACEAPAKLGAAGAG